MLCAGNTTFGSRAHRNDWICAIRRDTWFAIVNMKRNFNFF